MKKKFISKFLSFFFGVVGTADKHSFMNISANSKKFEMVLMGYSGARGTLNYEKNLCRKSRVRLLLSRLERYILFKKIKNKIENIRYCRK
jgi:hypothetical protein